MRLNKALPAPRQGNVGDLFPTRFSALEWLQAARPQNAVLKDITAGELYLVNAIIGAQQAVLKIYLHLQSIPLSDTPGVPSELDDSAILEYWTENLAAVNPALEKFLPILAQVSDPGETCRKLRDWSAKQKPAFSSRKSIFVFLSEPFAAYPDDLTAQAGFILKAWQPWLGDWAQRLLRGLDYVKEEQKTRFAGPGPVHGPDYSASWTENPERYSSDRDWMPSVVMIAKNALVWLDQLGQKYKRNISQLDEIPEEEISYLSAAGFNTLWLIGIWERSTASRTIKQWCGNPEAASSAYAIKRYEVASQLGGNTALEKLKAMCRRHGIRLASDMVPNHTALDSDWLMDHPDWFISRSDNPFPAYTYSGENLSGNDRIGIYLEDHYFTQSDAAVVFKRVDHESGEEHYIYHGNDGTTMPWNDTAQLNYLNAELREAVIQTILKVARQFPVIRFDAAMTLARKHYRRLWFPPPGSGSDIPSRSDYAMNDDEFDALFPGEFWREVVDRVATEAPDTLLLAEAFWLMEGYFVRTLGMHRVYNSAFMHMLKTERNRDYRKAIRETLAFDPDILKRYVNFMSNPDEDTARAQFGDGDKYFAVATLLATLPGLPLWGHGQTEGFREKYGMEFQRAYWNEKADEHLVSEHWTRIFPLFRRRRLFADVSNFRFYDFHTDHGVDENVFAYYNRADDKQVLVFVNNASRTTRGYIDESVPFRDKARNKTRSESFANTLKLPDHSGHFLAYRDMIRNREFIGTIDDLRRNGFSLSLEAYQSCVFSDFNIRPGSAELEKLCHRLRGKGVESLEKELLADKLRPAHDCFMKIVRAIETGKLDEAQNLLTEWQQYMNRQDDPEDTDLTEIMSVISRHCQQAESRAKDKPDWVIPVSALFAVIILAESLGREAWQKTYDDLWLALALERYLDIRSDYWEAVWAALTYISANDFAAFIAALPERPSLKTVVGYNEWDGTGYVTQEAWNEFFSLCYWLAVPGWSRIYPLAAQYDFRLKDIISALRRDPIHD